MMPEKLPDIVREYLFFRTKRPVQLVSPRTLKLAETHPPIPRFYWEDQGKRYCAYLETTVTDDVVSFHFHFSRNGIPITFQPVLNSYKRFLAREKIDSHVVA